MTLRFVQGVVVKGVADSVEMVSRPDREARYSRARDGNHQE
jgi:hypothetical protein